MKFCRIFLAGLSKLHFTSPDKHSDDLCFQKTTFPFITSGVYLQKLIPLLAENYWQACQKCTLDCPGQHFAEKIFLKGINFYHFLTLSRKISDFWQNVFCTAVEIALYVSR